MEEGCPWGDERPWEESNKENSRVLMGKPIVSCKWVFTMNFKVNWTLECYKEKFVAKSSAQTYSIDYIETFALVAKHNTIRILLSMRMNLEWQLKTT